VEKSSKNVKDYGPQGTASYRYSVHFPRGYSSEADAPQQGWGMTEATCSILGWDTTRSYDKNSVGELNANCKAKIMDPAETEVPIGERGEIWVQAPK